MNYSDRLRAALEAGHIQPGDVTHVEIEHRHRCPAPSKGPRWCNCAPTVRVLRDHEVLTIGTGGQILERSRKA
ncbi:hypothetical protein [Luteimonas changyuni]|uniref:hypothetical protein n=1 Tax=Luteimonas sp. MJ145 TaxID=3129234 RepID=UPI0031BAF0BB